MPYFTVRGPVPLSVEPPYEGPGDILSAIAWWGLRAYDAAYAAAEGPCIDIKRTSTGLSPMTINVLTDGSLDVATIEALGYGVTITKFYDQTGGGRHLDNDFGAFLLPPLGLNVFGALPAVQFDNVADNGIGRAASFPAQAQPFSVSTVARRTGATTGQTTIMTLSDGAANVSYDDSADTLYEEAGLSFTASATDNVLHSLHYVYNGASSGIVVDGGAAQTGNSGANNLALNGNYVLGSDLAVRTITGEICEFGLWSGAFSAGEHTALATNEKTYWGIS